LGEAWRWHHGSWKLVTMARGTPVPITPEVLDWAIQESGYGLAKVSEYLRVSEAEVRGWLSGGGQPKLTQFRKLAAFLKRPEAVFFLPSPPRAPRVEVEFRHPPGVKDRSPNPKERLRIREAARLQRGLAWALRELGKEGARLPKASASSAAEQVAARARELLGISVDKQLAWKSAYQALGAWRSALEDSGVTVLLLPMGKDAARGFSLWDERVPLVAANTHWNAQARAFTLFHEYGHLLTRTSSLCAAARPGSWDDGDRVERWCEEFAAAFLLPWSTVESLLKARGWRPGQRITELDPASWLSRKLHASLRATVLRLIGRRVADWSLYRKIPPVSDQKPEGGGGGEGRHRPDIRIDEYGLRTARIFLEGMQRDVLTRDDVLSYLDVADTDVPVLQELAFAE